MDGTNRVSLVVHLSHPWGVAVYGTFLYYTDRDYEVIERVDKATGANKVVLRDNVPRLKSLRVYYRDSEYLLQRFFRIFNLQKLEPSLETECLVFQRKCFDLAFRKTVRSILPHFGKEVLQHLVKISTGSCSFTEVVLTKKLCYFSFKFVLSECWPH